MKSFFLLGWQFLLHLLSLVTFTYKRRGLSRFRENFDPEHLLPLSEDDRRMLPVWQSCVACGLCDQVCPELLGGVASGRFVGPQAIASGSIGDLTALRWMVDQAKLLERCEGCGDCEALCPVEIPLRSLAAFIGRVGQEQRSRGASTAS